MVEIFFPTKYIEVGDPFFNQGIKDWSTLMSELNYDRWTTGSLIHVKPDNISVQNFLDLMSMDDGGEYWYTCYIKVLDLDIDNEIPVGLPDREYEVCIADCETETPVMETRVHTWRTWRDANHPLGDPLEDPNNIGTFHYYFVSYPFGTPLKDTELLIVHDSIDSELIDLKDVPYLPDMSGAETTKTVIL